MTTITELHVTQLSAGETRVTLRAAVPSGTILLGTHPITIVTATLDALGHYPDAYGAALTEMVFPDPLRIAWERARGTSDAVQGGMHVRVMIEDMTGALHHLRWELLRDPGTDVVLATQEHGSFARLVVRESAYDPPLPAKPDLRALVAIAGPVDAAQWNLPPVDVQAEVHRTSVTLGALPTTLLADIEPAIGLATLANLRAALDDSHPVLYIIAHGRATPAGSTLYLVTDSGKAAPITGEAFATDLKTLPWERRPLLAVLVACESASQHGAPFSAVGALLAQAGIPAVIAMQAPISMADAAVFTTRFLRVLIRTGRIDQAVAAARKAMGDSWWIPVLWLYRRDGRLWDAQAEPLPDQFLRAKLHDHRGFLASRLEAFVGRDHELGEIRKRIATAQTTGGYVTITGHAGQGKSSLIARLVADDLGVTFGNSSIDHLTECITAIGDTGPIYHFIPFAPGPDHQVSLLRNLIARLCLKYQLPASYADTESRPALRDYFAAALRDVAAQGHQEIIYIDGLDQIEEELNGERDLSFLPLEPPIGVVFVLGTRPNDTLKPLELRKPQHEYWLPSLSRADFDRILDHRSVRLQADLADQFYTAMQENALYLDLVAKELRAAGGLTPEELISHIADNPDNLFSVGIERMQRHERLWDTVLRPILRLLLVARAPVSQRALRTLTGADDLPTRRGLERLGGLLQRDGEGRYGLFHLKLGDFLREDVTQPNKLYVFATDEIEQFHQRFADWCMSGLGGLDVIWQDLPQETGEHERRIYARQHTIAHLAAARSYDRLWSIIDAGAYGKAKRRYDPSTRSYALDLDIARSAVVNFATGNPAAQVQTLPRLWRYSLVRCSLASQVDNYNEALFLAMVQLGRSDEAIDLAELLTDPAKKVAVLCAIGLAIYAQGDHAGIRILHRAHTVADAISDARRRAFAFITLAEAFAAANAPEVETILSARKAAEVIVDDRLRAITFSIIIKVLCQNQQWEQAHTIADAFEDPAMRDTVLRTHTQALVQAQHWEQARKTAESIADPRNRASTLSALALALAQANHPDANEVFTLARAAAEAIRTIESRASTLSALALALAQANHPDANEVFTLARVAAEAIEDAERRARILSTLALALSQANHPDAREIFTLALTTVENIDDTQRRVFVLTRLVQDLVQTQEWQLAHETAEDIDDVRERASALSKLAQALAQAKHLEANEVFTLAREAAEDIDDVRHRASALSKLAQALAEVNHPDAAEVLTLARTTAETTTDTWSFALTTLAHVLAQVKHPTTDKALTLARTTAEAISNAKRRSSTLRTLAQALAEVNHPDARKISWLARTTAIGDAEWRTTVLRTLAQQWKGARIIAKNVRDAGMQATALRILTQALAQAKQWEQARTMAEAIENLEMRVDALRMLAQALAHAQQWERANAIIEVIANGWKRETALHTLAVALAQAQQWEQARTTAEAIGDDTVKRDTALHTLAVALAQAQQWEQSRTIAKAIGDDWKRAEALCTLAQALAQAQQWEQARTTAETLGDDRKRAEALYTLAQALAAANLIPRYLAFLHNAWYAASSRYELLNLFAITPELLRAYPEIGDPLLDGFAWVDEQLQV